MALTEGPRLILYPEDFDYSKQSIELPGTKKPGQTGIYRNAAWPELLNYDSEQGKRSLYEVFQAGLEHSTNEPCLGHRPIISTNPLKFAPKYSWETYSQVDERRRNVGSALELLWQQKRAGGGDLPTVGIWSQNRPEWQVIDLAVQAYAKVSVSLYDTLGPDAVEYICNHAEISIVFVSSPHLPSILALSSRLSHLKVVVVIDNMSDEAQHVASSWAKHRKVELLSLKELEALGKVNRREIIPPTPEQVYSICYTSGTTGNPKGALLTHGQCAVAVLSVAMGVPFTEPGRLFSYLPLAHIYGRMAELVCLSLGGGIGYFTGDPARLLEDAQILKPTSFPSVPRVLNKIYQAANAAGDVPGFKGNIFRRAVATKLANLRATGELKHAFWDRIVFRKIQRVLGGQIENITSGSAPISADVIDFLKIAFACEVFEGMSQFYYFPSLQQLIFAMQETVAICTRSVFGDRNGSGTVGPPQPAAEVKLVDVPVMGYTSEDKPGPRGEFCSRGIVNFTMYYKDPLTTAATIDEEGWLHTGDIAEMDSCGRFKIIDRIKNIMKLSQGEYVALEKIESAYSAIPLISQIYVHGDSLRDHLVAIVIPDLEFLAGVASKISKKQVLPSDNEALEAAARDPLVKAIIFEELMKQGKKKGLKGFESVKNIHVSLDAFTTENDTLTPTFKIKRRGAYEMYKEVLEALYAETASAPSSTKVKL
ncbi:acetyl-CoA synthetase-like protein [Hysterangium stoloniferum]|nr:acetyl-CoA synthetase-like protein [Hysterangium stoloniferum]